MTVLFYDSNFEPIDVKSMNIIPLQIDISAPNPVHIRESLDNKNGTHTLGTKLEGRTLSVSFFANGRDKIDFSLLKSEIFNLFSGLDDLYIVDTKQPNKRWKTRVNGNYSFENITKRKDRLTIEFYSDSPYCESIGTTLDPLTLDSGKWQIGQGLVIDDVSYVHTSDAFQIHNPGVLITPDEFPMVIECKASTTSSNTTLRLKNTTTNNEWTYTGATIAGQIYQLKGVQTLLNGTSVTMKTNFEVITLRSGWNNFTKTNISEVKFNHRFYYL